MGDNTGIDTAFKEWAEIRAFELHEHETNTIKLDSVVPIFEMEGQSAKNATAAIEAFHCCVAATLEALMEAYRRGLAAGRTLDGITHDDFPEVRG